MSDEPDASKQFTANLSGDGAIAQGENAKAVGKRGVLIETGAHVNAPINTGDHYIIVADSAAQTNAPSASTLSAWLDWIASEIPVSLADVTPADDARTMATLVTRAGELLSDIAPSGDAMQNVRLMIATGLASWRLPEPLPAEQVESKILHSLAVAAVWPLVITKTLPEGSLQALREISSPEFVTLVTSARAVLPHKNLPGAAIMLAQNIRDPKYLPGLRHVLNDVRDPARGWPCIVAICAARDKRIPTAPENTENLLKWLLAGAGAGVGAGAAYAIAENIAKALAQQERPALPKILSPEQPKISEKDVRLPCGDTYMDFCFVRAGNFLMGSTQEQVNALKRESGFDWYKDELPQHTVYLSAYHMGKYPVTNAQYAQYAKARRKTFEFPLGKANHPAVRVSWTDANDFCNWMSTQCGQTITLPTEAEWEKAARGTQGWIYPWGNTPKPNKYLCNFDGNEKDTTPVGKYSPQGDSLYRCADMAGNVWEWCADWYDENTYAQHLASETRNPTGPATGAVKVIRGGYYFNLSGNVRCAFRLRIDFDGFDIGVGFRVVVRSH